MDFVSNISKSNFLDILRFLLYKLDLEMKKKKRSKFQKKSKLKEKISIAIDGKLSFQILSFNLQLN